MDLNGWTPWARITADKERKNDERFVSATPITLVAIGNRYDVPAYVPDSNFVVSSMDSARNLYVVWVGQGTVANRQTFVTAAPANNAVPFGTHP